MPDFSFQTKIRGKRGGGWRGSTQPWDLGARNAHCLPGVEPVNATIVQKKKIHNGSRHWLKGKEAIGKITDAVLRPKDHFSSETLEPDVMADVADRGLKGIPGEAEYD